MASEMMALVVGASAEELTRVQQCLGDCHCVHAPLNDQETTVSSIPEAAKLIIPLLGEKKLPGRTTNLPE